jgi:hypothetical protein
MDPRAEDIGHRLRLSGRLRARCARRAQFPKDRAEPGCHARRACKRDGHRAIRSTQPLACSDQVWSAVPMEIIEADPDWRRAAASAPQSRIELQHRLHEL